MTPSPRPLLKICCLQDEAEVATAADAGADLFGFVGRGLSGPEVIEDDDRIARLAGRVPAGRTSVLLTRQRDPAEVVRRVLHTRVGAVQLCDTMPPEVWQALRRHAPGVRILQVVHVSGTWAIDEARAVRAHVDGVVLDSGTPAGPAPVYGGSGRTHDWAISAQIVALTPGPVWLAGGLSAQNVGEAWGVVRPAGFDACSGFRTHGELDAAKVSAFVQALRSLG